MNIAIDRYHEVDSGNLRAYVDIRLTDVNIVIPSCSLLESKNGLWVALPQDSYIMKEKGAKVKKYKNKLNRKLPRKTETKLKMSR